jgi:tetratricopeptide (TPR) repeat protein
MDKRDTIATHAFPKANRRWRGMVGLILACLCLSLPGMSQNSRDLFVEPRRRVALVIGNANYPGHKLLNPVHDAEDVSAALKSLGFQVTLGKDLSRRAMQDQVTRFVTDLRDGDIALFYFAGHGMQLDGENLLVPTDFPTALPNQATEAKAACFRFDDLQRSLEHSKAGLSIMVMDACRNSPYRRSTRAWDQGGLAPVNAGLGVYIAFSASPGQTADDNPDERNGLFTKFLLKALQQPPPLSQVFRRVRDDVYQASQTHQRPFLVDQITGDFSFLAKAAAGPAAPPQTQPAVAAPPPDPVEDGLELYRQGKCQAALDLFDRAVREHPKNPYAQNAAGMAYVCLKRYNPAIERFDMAIQLKPDYGAAYLNRGAAYSTAGQYELAVEDFNWAVEQEPWNPVFFTRRGQAYFNLRKYEEALADFNSAIGFDPAAAEAFHGRGQVRERQGHYREAADDFMAALERNANFTEARQDLERVRKRL